MKPEEVDRCMTLGAGYPMGPLALLDLVGIDVAIAIGEALFADTARSTTGRPGRLIDAGRRGQAGRKTGAGFYDYGRAGSAASCDHQLGDRLPHRVERLGSSLSGVSSRCRRSGSRSRSGRSRGHPACRNGTWSSMIARPSSPSGKTSLGADLRRGRRAAAPTAPGPSCASRGSAGPRWRRSRAGSARRPRPVGLRRRPSSRAARTARSCASGQPGGSSSPSKRTKRTSRWSVGQLALERLRQLDHRRGAGGAVVGADVVRAWSPRCRSGRRPRSPGRCRAACRRRCAARPGPARPRRWAAARRSCSAELPRAPATRPAAGPTATCCSISSKARSESNRSATARRLRPHPPPQPAAGPAATGTASGAKPRACRPRALRLRFGGARLARIGGRQAPHGARNDPRSRPPRRPPA